MAQQTKSATTEATAQAPATKLIVAIKRFDRYWVYFKGIAPENNVGCACRTAQKAINYMKLLTARHQDARIDVETYARLQEEAQKEALI